MTIHDNRPLSTMKPSSSISPTGPCSKLYLPPTSTRRPMKRSVNYGSRSRHNTRRRSEQF
ncbi:hypothetical protein C8Q75DRAFT_785565 [Abortiporus biennis]|nr:hypothetical protein C8Q75DRAFT_785565 [Abortiporus biennis]